MVKLDKRMWAFLLKQFNIEKIISKLKEKRSILVSEADLQLEMALIIKVGQDKYNPEAYSANGYWWRIRNRICKRIKEM